MKGGKITFSLQSQKLWSLLDLFGSATPFFLFLFKAPCLILSILHLNELFWWLAVVDTV